MLLDVISPKFKTYEEKLNHMKEVEAAINKPDLVFTPEIHRGKGAIVRLIDKTLKEGKEGIVATHLTKNEEENPRIKIVHKVMHNLKVVGVHQEYDKDGNPKQSMGAVDVADATGKIVGKVGTGWSRAEREAAFKDPSSIIGKDIQVVSRGIARNALRQPVYNGEADGDVDTVV